VLFQMDSSQYNRDMSGCHTLATEFAAQDSASNVLAVAALSRRKVTRAQNEELDNNPIGTNKAGKANKAGEANKAGSLAQRT